MNKLPKKTTAKPGSTQVEEAFIPFLRSACRWNPGDRILLAFSSGLDSVCLAHLLDLHDIHFAIAHVNFRLRSSESEQDVVFARKSALKMGVEFLTESFDTAEWASHKGQSVQMAARNLRYEWLEKRRSTGRYHCIATAHHLDDQMESMLLNLQRGTGLAGLHGIAPRRNHLIRPLMNRTRAEIHDYALSKNLVWREDSSNEQTRYTRNFIRHKVIAPWKENLDNLTAAFSKSADQIRQQEKLYKLGFERTLAKITRKRDDELHLSINGLLKTGCVETLLHEVLHPRGFTNSQMKDIEAVMTGPPGKQFLSESHRLIVDRKFLILTDVRAEKALTAWIENGANKVRCGETQLKFQQIDFAAKSTHQSVSMRQQRGKVRHALFDLSKIDFPLELRIWKPGDYFYPLGLKRRGRDDRMGKKKVSDLLTDLKLPLIEKEKVTVLASAGRIMWVVGLRTDERFKVKAESKRLLSVKLL